MEQFSSSDPDQVVSLILIPVSAKAE